jgi:heme-degrading monooxygenase HmoA
MVVSIVRLHSRQPDAEVQALFEERAPRHEDVPGLLEKTHLRSRDTGESGAVDVWGDEPALSRLRAAGASLAPTRSTGRL